MLTLLALALCQSEYRDTFFFPDKGEFNVKLLIKHFIAITTKHKDSLKVVHCSEENETVTTVEGDFREILFFKCHA